MGAWNIIKDELTRGLSPGTPGYIMALNKAADLFVVLRPYLKSKEEKHSMKTGK